MFVALEGSFRLRNHSLLVSRFFLAPNLCRLQPEPREVRFAGSFSTALALGLWQEPLAGRHPFQT